ncbi:MAG: LysR family transcriptional regulator [Pseudomonadota bacterium]
MDWEAIRCFVAVAEEGSFSAAASSVGLSVATMTRRIDSLESTYGVRLFRRTPRGVRITDHGAVLLRHAQASARHMASLAQTARALGAAEGGVVIRVSSTEVIMSRVLAPRLAKLMEMAPQVRLELEVDTGLADLVGGGVDIAVRLAKPTAPGLAARRLPRVGLSLYCSSTYLAGRDPRQVQLERERLLWLDSKLKGIPENLWLAEHGLEPAAVLRSGSFRALELACVQGLGIAPLPEFIGRDLGLVEVLGPTLPARQPWIVFHRDSRNVRPMQLVRRWIADTCQEAF